MRLLFLYAQLGEPIEDFVSFDFQLPRQLVNPNLLHRKNNLLLRPLNYSRAWPLPGSAPSDGAAPSGPSPSVGLSVGNAASSIVPKCSACSSSSAAAAADPGSNRSSGLSGS